jgi:hypothetical protein
VSVFNPPPFRPATPNPGRVAERPPGRPPWVSARRLSSAGAGLLILGAAATVGGVLSLVVAVWRLIDRATDLR